MKNSGIGAVVLLLLLFFLAVNLFLSSTLHAQAPFYQGKSIRFIIGSQARSLYDLWARLFADHMGKYIAGNPAVVGQRIPGDASEIAAKNMYNVTSPPR